MDALVKTKFKIIVRPHPQSKTSEKDLLARLESRYKNAENLFWNYDNDNLAVMNESDILITDFSGIIFDYAFLLNRPLIYADTEFDNSVYDAVWIDRPQWRFRVLPTIGIPLRKEDFPNLKEIIEKALSDKKLEEGRKAAKSEAWQNQGKSAEATVDFLLSFKKEGDSQCKR